MDDRLSRFFVAILVLGILVIGSAPLVYAAAQLSGTVSSSKSLVAYGNSFTVTVGVKNSGTTAYCASISLSIPSGFTTSQSTRVYVGDLAKGASRSFSFSVTAPFYSTSGTFSATVFYSNNFNCGGTFTLLGLVGLLFLFREGASSHSSCIP